MAFHELSKTELTRLKLILSQAEEAHGWLDELASAKRDAFDDKSDKYKESDNGSTADELINALEGIRDNFETVKDELSSLEGISD